MNLSIIILTDSQGIEKGKKVRHELWEHIRILQVENYR